MYDGYSGASVLFILHLGNGSQQKQHLPIRYRRNTGSESSLKACFCLLFHNLFFIFPLPAKGRIGKNIIKSLIFKFIVRQCITILNIIGIISFDQHICFTDCKGLVIDFLSECHYSGIRINLIQIFLCHRQHSSGSACRVIYRFDHILSAQYLTVIIKQNIDHKLDHFSRRIMLACIFVMCFGKSPDDFLKYISHGQI